MSAVKINMNLFLSPLSPKDIEIESDSESCSMSFVKFPKLEHARNMTILEEMGFKIEAESSPYIIDPKNKRLVRKSSIGVSDFWSSNEKEKFLKEKGYWGIYKTMQMKEAEFTLKTKKSIREPSLPHIMDLNAMRRIKLKECKKKIFNSPGSLSLRSPLAEDTPRKIEFHNKCSTLKIPGKKSLQLKTLDLLLNKCNSLASDTLKMKSLTERFKKSFSQQCVSSISKQPVKKLTFREMKKIHGDIKQISKRIRR
ncbi:hypothetical protein SteCoe_25766 [Stentor coeruleus]|uniref:Uncharacterized protein n=1 Tax=Stentor coeruleus TaxID=5963 RepID=A0A1R2BES0_9CILI|nr:hypothetical protein SteCoe_25766 [Stentor coeruleus]